MVQGGGLHGEAQERLCRSATVSDHRFRRRGTSPEGLGGQGGAEQPLGRFVRRVPMVLFKSPYSLEKSSRVGGPVFDPWRMEACVVAARVCPTCRRTPASSQLRVADLKVVAWASDREPRQAARRTPTWSPYALQFGSGRGRNREVAQRSCADEIEGRCETQRHVRAAVEFVRPFM